RKSSRPISFSPLQRIVAEDITDPAERAALDEARNQHRRREARQAQLRGEVEMPKRLSRILDLCRQLPECERAGLLARLAAQLSPDEQLEVLADVLLRLATEALRQLEDELRSHIAKHPA